MISIIVKDTKAQALAAAKARGVDITINAEIGKAVKSIPDCNGYTADENFDKVARWFAESDTVIPARGYPAGTLLHFSMN